MASEILERPPIKGVGVRISVLEEIMQKLEKLCVAHNLVKKEDLDE